MKISYSYYKKYILLAKDYIIFEQNTCSNDNQLQSDQEKSEHLTHVRNAYCSYVNHVWGLNAPKLQTG